MPKRSSTKKDINQIAASIVAQVTGDSQTRTLPDEKPEKNPAAVALGRLGGLKGGKARAKALPKSKRISIAKNAAAKRWSKKNNAKA